VTTDVPRKVTTDVNRKVTKEINNDVQPSSHTKLGAVLKNVIKSNNTSVQPITVEELNEELRDSAGEKFSFSSPGMMKLRKTMSIIIISAIFLTFSIVAVARSRLAVIGEFKLLDKADRSTFVQSELVSVLHVLFLAAMLSCLIYSLLVYNMPVLSIAVLVLYINTAFVVRACPITTWQNKIRAKINLEPVNYLHRYFNLNLKAKPVVLQPNSFIPAPPAEQLYTPSPVRAPTQRLRRSSTISASPSPVERPIITPLKASPSVIVA